MLTGKHSELYGQAAVALIDAAHQLDQLSSHRGGDPDLDRLARRLERASRRSMSVIPRRPVMRALRRVFPTREHRAIVRELKSRGEW